MLRPCIIASSLSSHYNDIHLHQKIVLMPMSLFYLSNIVAKTSPCSKYYRGLINGAGDQEKALIFASERNLAKVGSHTKTILADGTFYSVCTTICAVVVLHNENPDRPPPPKCPLCNKVVTDMLRLY